jgi:hypothetical protein
MSMIGLAPSPGHRRRADVLQPHGDRPEGIGHPLELLARAPRPVGVVVHDPDRGVEALVERRVALHRRRP